MKCGGQVAAGPVEERSEVMSPQHSRCGLLTPLKLVWPAMSRSTKVMDRGLREFKQ